jgi:putative membrane protein
MCGALGFISSVFAQAAKTDAQAFLEKAAEVQQIQISLGQLATQRAVNERVKDFGQQMVDDYKQGSQQVEQLAMKGGMQLSPGVSEEHKQKVNKLSQLSGHAFDRAYIDYILQDHETTVDEFQRRVGTMQDQGIKQWIASILPTLESHRERAHQVKYSLQTNP